ncbi:MAG: bifunctional hydroxymethylpyrimidine kinase/phosphomethylpyrimidine kinase [Candidatus Lokiarchaeota archaeon]|nr:bifunctional hydroxymethylpyrimidine kinase/phosphomethylpyrimidine kinase [Candidatus Lokiarchaeota archaeon]
MKMKKVLTIAGSDSGGGAGIQADLKTFSARGVYGMSAITALTAQNSMGVQRVYEIDPSFVGEQIDSIMSDIGADAWKTGMLVNTDIIRIVADRARKYNIKFLVIDPVMIAKSGDYLLKTEAIETLISELVSMAYVITPNHHEVQALTNINIENLTDAREAAQEIHNQGAQNVVIKGGHLPDIQNAIDLLYDGNNFTEFHAPRIKTKNTHGTGCTFASAIAAELAKGNDIKSAVHIAKAFLTAAIQKADGMRIGKGYGPTNHSQGNLVEVDLSLVKVK